MYIKDASLEGLKDFDDTKIHLIPNQKKILQTFSFFAKKVGNTVQEEKKILAIVVWFVLFA